MTKVSISVYLYMQFSGLNVFFKAMKSLHVFFFARYVGITKRYMLKEIKIIRFLDKHIIFTFAYFDAVSKYE